MVVSVEGRDPGRPEVIEQRDSTAAVRVPGLPGFGGRERRAIASRTFSKLVGSSRDRLRQEQQGSARHNRVVVDQMLHLEGGDANLDRQLRRIRRFQGVGAKTVQEGAAAPVPRGEVGGFVIGIEDTTTETA